MKNSSPDIANGPWELSKVMDGTNPEAFLEMHRMIKYAIDNKNLGLKVEPNRNVTEL